MMSNNLSFLEVFLSSWTLASIVGLGILIGVLLGAVVISKSKKRRQIPAMSKQIPEALRSREECNRPRDRLSIKCPGGDRWYQLPDTVPLHGYHDENGMLLWDERPGHEGETTFLIDADDVDCRLWHATVHWDLFAVGNGDLIKRFVAERPSEYTASDLVVVSAPDWADRQFQALSTGHLV